MATVVEHEPLDQPITPPADEGVDLRRDTADHDEIARRAYSRFEMRGGEHGRDQEDWFAAEHELKNSEGRE
jgi:hypothetical protein